MSNFLGMKIYLVKCRSGLVQSLKVSAILVIIAVLMFWLDSRLAGFSFALLSLGVCISARPRSFLTADGRSSIGMAFILFATIPIVVALLLWSEAEYSRHLYVANFYDKYLSRTLWGMGRTSDSLLLAGFNESAIKVKFFAVVIFIPLTFFAANLVVSLVSSHGRVSYSFQHNSKFNPSPGKGVMACWLIAGFFAFFPFVFDSYTEHCIGRRGCGLESGRVSQYLIFMYLSLALGYLFAVSAVWVSYLTRMVKINKGDNV